MILTTLLGLLASIWSRFWLQLSLIGAAIVGLAYVFARGRAAGRYQYEVRQRELNSKAAQRTAKIINKVRDAGNDEIQRRLDRYYRD